MRTRPVVAAAVFVSALLAGCSGDPVPAEATEPPQAVETEAPGPAASESGPSREGLVKALADGWGGLSEQERVEMCDAVDETTGGGMWEALGSPESISKTEVDMIMADYCRDY